MISSKLVPRILTDEQKQRQHHISYDLLNKAERYLTGSLQVMKRGVIFFSFPFLWFCFAFVCLFCFLFLFWGFFLMNYIYTIRKQNTRTYNGKIFFFFITTEKNHACLDHSSKTKLACFFDHRRIVLNKLTTVNQNIRLKVLKGREEPGKWIFFYDSIPVHVVLGVQAIMAEKSITKMDYPSYSPDLAFWDFWLFSKL